MNISLEIISTVLPAGWVTLTLGILILVWGCVVLVQDTQKRRGRFFLAYSFVVFLWGVGYAFLSGARDADSFYSVLNALYLIAGFVPLLLINLFHDAPMRRGLYPLWRQVLVFLPYSIAIGLILVPGFTIERTVLYGLSSGAFYVTSGTIVYLLYLVALSAILSLILVKKYRTSEGIFKVQTRATIISFFIAIAVALLIAIIAIPREGIGGIFLAGFAGALVNALIFSSILIKYNFWSVKILLIETLSLLAFVAMSGTYFFAVSFSDTVFSSVLSLGMLIATLYLVTKTKRMVEAKDKVLRLRYELNDTQKRLKVLDKKKSEFLAMTSHHLRDPLTVIKGYASMLLEGSYGELNPPLQGAIEKVFESSKRLISMISDFMEISAMETGDIKYNFADVDMKKLLLGTAENMRLSAERAGLGFSVSIDTSVWVNYTVSADLGKIRQAIMSIIDNAIKYTPRGSINISLGMGGVDKRSVLIRVIDTGIGMNDVTMEKIFTKFSRADGANKTYTEGSGLGLYVAQEILKRHGGRVRAESKGDGLGSTFSIELPAKKGTRATA